MGVTLVTGGFEMPPSLGILRWQADGFGNAEATDSPMALGDAGVIWRITQVVLGLASESIPQSGWPRCSERHIPVKI